MIEWIIQFWSSNSGSIIVSVLVGFLFFVLGPLGLWFSGRRIRKERVRKAKEQLLDLLEGMIVNQSAMDERKLMSVFRAVERDIDIELSSEYGLESWLGDSILRFERSRHLSADQKTSYYDVIRKLLDEIKEKRVNLPTEEIPRQYESIFEDIKNALATDEPEKANNLLVELEKKISKKPSSQDPLLNVFRIYLRMFDKNPVTFVVATIVIVAGYAYFFVNVILK